MHVLLSAYACRPGGRSESALGWDAAAALAEANRVWVLTTEYPRKRAAIDAALAERPRPGLGFVYSGTKRRRFSGMPGDDLRYYLWQIAAARRARAFVAQEPIDVVHHVTFARYWTPSFLTRLGAPMVFGPVGGGESVPEALRGTLSPAAARGERLRDMARSVAEADPYLRRTLRESAVCLAATVQTAERMRALGARDVRVLQAIALPGAELDALARVPPASAGPFRVVSIGRLIGWKGYHLGLEAFARAAIPGSEYWLVGEGPERPALEALARRLGVERSVRFVGKVPRAAAFEHLSACHVLLHPSLHDSGGYACLEAMAAGRPVLCLDAGGPAVQVAGAVGADGAAAADGSGGPGAGAGRPPPGGIVAGVESVEQALDELAAGMRLLADDATAYRRLADAARSRAGGSAWSARARLYGELYREVAGRSPAWSDVRAAST